MSRMTATTAEPTSNTAEVFEKNIFFLIFKKLFKNYSNQKRLHTRRRKKRLNWLIRARQRNIWIGRQL